MSKDKDISSKESNSPQKAEAPMSEEDIQMKEMMKREMLERIETMIMTNNETALKAIRKMMGSE
jgi:hypothetical protein